MGAVLRCGEVPSEPRAHGRANRGSGNTWERCDSCHLQQQSFDTSRAKDIFFCLCVVLGGLKVRIDASWRLRAPALPTNATMFLTGLGFVLQRSTCFRLRAPPLGRHALADETCRSSPVTSKSRALLTRLRTARSGCLEAPCCRVVQ